MKSSKLAVSLFALTLFALPAAAQQTTGAAPAQPAAAQPDNAAQQALKTFLADTRPASALTLPELRQRLLTARGLLEGKSLDPESLRQVRAVMKDARTEMSRRQAAGGGKAPQLGGGTAAQQPPASDSAGTASPPEATAQAAPQTTAPAAGGSGQPGNASLDQFLTDARPASALSDAELKQRFDTARGFLPNQSLTTDQRQALQKIARESRIELGRRSSGKQQTGAASGSAAGQPPANGGTATGHTQAGNGQTAAPQVSAGQQPAPTSAGQILNDQRPLSTMNVQDLRSRIRAVRDLQKNPATTADQRRRLADMARAARMEIISRGGLGGGNIGGQSGNGQGGMNNGQANAGGAFSADAEKRAQGYLNNPQRAEQMSPPDLRNRLQGMRDLLQANQLSPATERALRIKLRADRDVLRGRLGAGQGGEGQAGGGNGQANGGGGAAVNINVILADRRPPNQLQEWELRRRIDVYRDAVLNQQYAAAQRADWQMMLARDREFMRQMLIERRRARMAELARERQANQINIDLGMRFDPGRPPPPSVFAAEVDDQQLADVLSAPPRRAIDRRYSIQEVENSPDLRDALPRVELDTIHFGFGESFVREEEVDNLDRVAAVLEKILAVHPREVFIIEGHTDAVGSPESNLELSRKRAAAVKQALVDYYVIPPENLQTVGYGERFLKIPTPEPEPENRRVSIVRATPLVGELGQ